MRTIQTQGKDFFLWLLWAGLPLITQAQLSGTYTVGTGGDYATIAAAVADLNAQGVGSGGVTFNVAAGHTESVTSPITITATGTASNPIVFQKSGSGDNPIINRTDAGSLSTITFGGAGDAIIRLEGTDYITFDGIDVSASNQGIEYGYLTHKPSGTNGCQYVTIKNCTISMTKGNKNYVTGIYISNGTTSINDATGVTVTSTGGINANITIKGDTIKNVNAGVHVRGCSARYDSAVIIGQSEEGNTITGFGNGNDSSDPAYGIYFIYVKNPSVAYNTITSTSYRFKLYGIYYSTVSGNVTGSHNFITLANDYYSSAVSPHTYYIAQESNVSTEDFSYNTFAANTLSSAGNVYLIYALNNTPNKTINNNQTSGSINRSAGSGNFYCYYNYNSSPSSGTETINNNIFSNISVTGSSTLYGIYSKHSTSYQNRVCSGNTISNLTGGTGSIYPIQIQNSNTNQVYNNNVFDITGGGLIYGIYCNESGNTQCYQNQVYDLTSNITGSSESTTIYGIYIYGSSGKSVYAYNNFISDLKTPSSNSTTGLRGIYVAGSSTIGLYYNTIYLNATSTGTNFGASGIYSSTTPTLDLRNNIVVNLSIPNGTGVVAAYRRSGINLASYSSNSNHNLFYAGTPASNRLIFYDGTNADSTLAAFKVRVAPGDANSVTENPPFVNVTTTPYDLRINTSVATQVESGGTPISTPNINTDFDGTSRHATTPDIGAHESYITGRWIGRTSSDWANDHNWDNDALPTTADNVTIAPGAFNMPQITQNPSSPAVCNNLNIASGQSMTINAGKTLTVSGMLTNNGTLTIKSDANGAGSLIHNSSGVSANVERYIEGDWGSWDAGWHLISSPVASQAISAFETTGTGNGYDFYGWDEANNLWMNYKDAGFSTWNGSGNFVVGRGYLMSYEQTQTGKSFSGNLNVSDVSISGLSYTPSQGNGWQLLGNPFASALVWNNGNWNLSNVAGTAKIWHSTNKSYSDIAANDIIPSAQGFFVQVTNANNSLTIPASARTHSSQAWYKNSDVPQLKLIARPADGSSAQETLIRIEPEATPGNDPYWDSRFLAGYAPQLYSLADGVKLSTNALPSISEAMEIPLGFEKNQHNNFTLELSDNSLSAVVLLKDLKTGITHNLTQQPVYTFTSAEGDDPLRFKLAFASVGLEPAQQDLVPYAWYAFGMLHFRNVETGSWVEVYAANGQRVMREQFKGDAISLKVAPGVYMVKINEAKQQNIQKIVIF